MAHDYHRITRQIGISYLITILIFIFNPLLIFILTRTLTVMEYGVYSILAGTITVVSIFIELGISQYISTKFPGMKFDKKVKSFFSLLLFEIIFILIFISIIYIPFITNAALSFLKIMAYKFEFHLVLWILFFEGLFRIVTSIFYADKRIEFHNFTEFMRRGVWIFLLVVFILAKGDLILKEVFSLWLAGVIFTVLFSMYFLRKEFTYFAKHLSFSFSSIKKGLAFGLPVLPLIISNWIIVIADRYILNYYKGAESVAIYSLAYSLMTIIFSFAIVFSTVVYPYIAEAWHKKKDYNFLFNAVLKYNMIIVFPCTFGMFFLRRQIITLISGVKYVAGSPVIVILFLYPFLAAFINLLYYNILVREKTRQVMIYYILGAVLNIILNIIFIPKYGMFGAAIATVISYLFMFSSLYLLSRRDFHWNLGFLKPLKIFVAALVMGVAVALLNPQIFTTKILVILFGMVFYIGLLFLFRVFVKEEIRIMRNIRQIIRAKAE